MGEWSSLPAMEINPVGFGAKNRAALAESDLAQLRLDQARQLAPLDLQEKQATVPLTIRQKQNEQRVSDIDTGNKVIGQVVRDTMAADPEERAKVWDRGMQGAVDSGVAAARQHIGHFRDDLMERMDDVYNGAAEGKRGGGAIDAKAGELDRQAVERQVAQMKPAELVQSAKRANDIINSFNKVTDKDSWDHEIEYLKMQGIDVAQIMPNTEWSALNYTAVKNRITKKLAPYRDAMMDRSMVLGIGAKPPEPTPVGKSTYIGTDPDTHQPVYHNQDTGQDTRGPYAVQPKGSAGLATFQGKYMAALNSGMGDSDALQFANGRKSLPPERLQAIALQQATKQLADETLAGATIENPEAWVRSKTVENMTLLTKAAGSGSAPAPAAQRGGGGGGGPPQQVMDQLKKAGGKPLRFGNQQVWKWQNGRAVRVQ